MVVGPSTCSALSLLDASNKVACYDASRVRCGDGENIRHAGVANLCPSSCPYADFASGSDCTIRCVPEDECAHYNRLSPWARKDHRICAKCAEQFCAKCSATGCESCIANFELLEGNCVYQTPMVGTVVIYSICIMIPAMLIFVLYAWLKKAPEDWDYSARHALEHRRRTFVRKDNPINWSGRSKTYVPLGYSFTDEFLCGVGLPLYYRSLQFMGIIAAIGLADLILIDFFIPTPDWRDANNCSQSLNLDQLQEKNFTTHVRGFAGVTILLIAFFITSLIFASSQKLCAGEWDAKFCSMEDFSITASGFAPDHTDAGMIQQWMEQVLEFPIHGVSIAYSYHSHNDKALVDEYIEKSVVIDDVRFGVYEEEVIIDPSELKKVRDFLRRVRSSGICYIVFRNIEDAEAALDKFADAKNKIEFDGHKISFESTLSEPPSILWANFTFTSLGIGLRMFLSSAATLLLIACFGYFVYSSILEYIMDSISTSGEIPNSFVAFLLGLLIAGENLILTQVIAYGANFVGFHNLDSQNSIIMGWCFVKVMLSTLFSAWLTYYQIASRRLANMDQATEDARMQMRHSTYVLLGVQIYQVLLPGSLMVPYISWPFVGYDFLFYIKRMILWSKKKITPRECEKGFEPPEIWIAWDYASNLVMVCSISLVLIYDFPGRWMAFAWYFAWAWWMYWSQRYCHLRMSKRTFFTTYTLDAWFCRCCSVVVLELCIIEISWIISYLETVHMITINTTPLYVFALVPAAVHLSILESVIGLSKPLEVHEEDPKPYEEVTEDCYYTYFNTNPVHVLKSRFIHNEGPHLSYYITGKEYLFRKGGENEHASTVANIGRKRRTEGKMESISSYGVEHHEMANLVANVCENEPGSGDIDELQYGVYKETEVSLRSADSGTHLLIMNDEGRRSA